MTRYEKIVLLLVLAALSWQTVPTPGHVTALFFSVWLLTLSYLVGGYWLFARSPAPPGWVRVVAGACLGVSLTSLVPAIDLRIQLEPIYNATPIANGVGSLALGIFLILRRQSREIQAAYRPLFWRSLVVLLGCAFLVYSPVTFGPYRAVMLALNQGNPLIHNNLLMFEYNQRRQQALVAQDYEAAIGYARQSLRAGKRWLDEDSVTDAYRISGVFTNVYETYQTQADTAYAYSKFAEALQLYQAGHRYLLAADTRSSRDGAPALNWEKERILSNENMGLCCLRLGQYTASDSLFVEALNLAEKLHLNPKTWRPALLADLGESLAADRQFKLSSRAYRTANRLLAQDPSRAKAVSRLNNSLVIALNTIKQDSILPALLQLSSLHFSSNDSTTYYKGQLYQAICAYQLARYPATDQLLRRCLQAQLRRNRLDAAALLVYQLLLAKNALALAHYPQASAYLAAAQTQLPAYQRTRGSGAGASNCLSVSAAINKSTGHYFLATQQYGELVALLPNDEASSKEHLAENLTGLTDLNVILDDLPAARSHRNALLALLADSPTPLTPNQTGLLATVAYVDYASGKYAAAHTRYQRVLACNQQFGQAQSATSATAWNGLGLLATAQHHYPLADSLFQRALALHQQLFGDQHPATGVVYLNYGQLRLRENDPAAAQQFFDQSLHIAQAFFSRDHDVFADLYMALGALAQRRQQNALARTYYQQALPIYLAKLGSSHWKTRLAQRKANQR